MVVDSVFEADGFSSAARAIFISASIRSRARKTLDCR